MIEDQISLGRLTGDERLHRNGTSQPATVLNFWQWSSSQLLDNTTRGLLAEFIVACDLGISGGVRREWEPYDLITEEGITVEVKSASYVQNWGQKRLSNITFGIQPTFAWDSRTNEYDKERKRQADFYVFCILHHKDRQTIDPLNLEQWEFYVLPTRTLNSIVGDQKTITFSRLAKIGPHKATYGEIKKVINSLRYC